jgi:cell division protein FtsW
LKTFTAILQRHSIHILLLMMAGLVALGIVVLFSTSAFAEASIAEIPDHLKKQALWLGVGLVVCTVSAMIDYHMWQKLWWLVFAVAVILLALCFVPHIGVRTKGAARWVALGVGNFQPSELAKVASVMFLAWWYARFAPRSREFLVGFVAPMAVVSILLGLIIIEVDLGATALIGAAMFATMFVAGAGLRYLVPLALFGVAGVVYVATHIQERMGRLLAFLYPDKYPDEFYQQLQGLIAIGSGGLGGLGLGNGRQKMSYLPEAHNDFIFPIIGEELGLRVTLPVMAVYLIFGLCGYVVSLNARDRFGTLLGFGFITTILLQAAVNIGVTTALLPNKGMGLPFISYGGSNLLVCMFMVGVLINIHRHGRPVAIPLRQVKLAARVTPRI